MANLWFDNLQVYGRHLKVIAGSFAPNGSSAISSASNKGLGWTVAYTSTGLYTVTLSQTYAALIAGSLSLQLASGDDKVLQWGAVDVASAKTLEIRCWDISGAAVADIAADAGNRIHFALLLKNSSSGPT